MDRSDTAPSPSECECDEISFTIFFDRSSFNSHRLFNGLSAIQLCSSSRGSSSSSLLMQCLMRHKFQVYCMCEKLKQTYGTHLKMAPRSHNSNLVQYRSGTIVISFQWFRNMGCDAGGHEKGVRSGFE